MISIKMNQMTIILACTITIDNSYVMNVEVNLTLTNKGKEVI